MIDLFRPFQRSGLANPEPWLVDFAGGSLTKAGQRVNPVTALELVFDCVRVRSETLASLPLKLFRQDSAGNRTPAVDHPLYRIAFLQPHPELTSFEWRNMLNAHVDLRGNAYAQIVRNNGGDIVRLVPLHPDRVTVRRSENYDASGIRPLIYEVTNVGLGGTVKLSAFDILHLRGMSTDGMIGVSPVRVMAEMLGLAMAENEHSSRLFSNGAKPAGVLEHPAKLGDDGRKNLRDSWQKIHGGAENAGKVAILEEGMKFHEVGLSNIDAQLIESRRFSREKIASMYRVPLHMIGGGDKANFTIEQQSLNFIAYCLLPIIENWEQRMNTTLLTEKEQQTLSFKFNVASLVRGDLKTRYDAHRTGVGMAGAPGWLTVNEVRQMEDMNSIAGGDKLFTGMDPNAQSKAIRILAPQLVDNLGRILRKEAKAVRAIAKKPDSVREMDAFYVEHRRFVLEVMGPISEVARQLSASLPTPEIIADHLISASRSDLAAAQAEPTKVENLLITWETTRAASTAAEIIEKAA